MVEYVTKEQAKDALLYLDDDLAFVPEDRIEEISNAWNDEIRRLPAADVAPVVHAHWIKDECAFMRCSQCGYENDWEWATPYCPSCGARMDGEEE